MRRRSGFGWLELVAGILLIALGIWAFMDPGLALAGMVFAYGVAAIIIGIADIILYIQVERYIGLGPVISLIAGILSVMTGIMLLVYPGAGTLALTLLFPIWFIAHCICRQRRPGGKPYGDRRPANRACRHRAAAPGALRALPPPAG